MTAPDGTILDGRLLVTKEEVSGEMDQHRVFYFDLLVRREAPSR